MVSPFTVEMLLPAFLNGLAVKAKPPQKEATLQIISALAAKAPRAVGCLVGNAGRSFIADRLWGRMHGLVGWLMFKLND